jgi:ACS family tartrate transporter-like MFS transporter
VGNLGGFVGPYAMGVVRDFTGSFTIGLMTIASGALISAIAVFLLGHDRRLEIAPAVKPAE